jgi:hypothetical protein
MQKVFASILSPIRRCGPRKLGSPERLNFHLQLTSTIEDPFLHVPSLCLATGAAMAKWCRFPQSSDVQSSVAL